MDTSKLSRYDWVVLGGMVVMFFTLFFTWYHVENLQRFLNEAPQSFGNVVIPSVTLSGWHFFAAVLAWLLTLVAAGVVLMKTLPSVTFRLPVPEGVAGMVLGAIAFVLVLYRVIAVPAPADAFGRGAGVFIALLATLAVAVGGFLKNAEPR